MAEVNLLRAVQKAAKEPKHWRAAAWLLERRNPEDFAARQPSVVTSVQIADFIGQIVELIDDELPHENYRRAMRKINQWLVDNQAAYQPILVGVAEDASEDPPPAAASHGKHKRISHLTSATGHPRALSDAPPQQDNPSSFSKRTSDDVQQCNPSEPNARLMHCCVTRQRLTSAANESTMNHQLGGTGVSPVLREARARCPCHPADPTMDHRGQINSMIITIDGPAGAGKSSAARALARRLGFRFLDTGAMYRAVALAGMRRGPGLGVPEDLARAGPNGFRFKTGRRAAVASTART